MHEYILYWESEYGLENFTCTAISEVDAKAQAAEYDQEIIDCLVGIEVIDGDSEMSKEQALDKLLNAMMIEHQLKETITNMLHVQLEHSPELKPYRELMHTLLTKHLSYENVKPKFAKLYDEKFTLKEVEEITEFYLTPTGSKLVKLVPEITVQSAKIGSDCIANKYDELETLMEKAINNENN